MLMPRGVVVGDLPVVLLKSVGEGVPYLLHHAVRGAQREFVDTKETRDSNKSYNNHGCSPSVLGLSITRGS